MSRRTGVNKKVIAVSLLGNCLELYDLGLCGFLLPVITPLFFPTDNDLLRLFVGMSIFAVGFIMRPLGGFLFGYLGDTFGRKMSLSNSMLLMALPTLVLSILPLYSSIGIIAPILFLICRMLQGICVGGEYNNAAIYLLESSDPKKQGFLSGLLTTSSNLGFAIASGLSMAVLSLPYSSEWTWRIPFLIGAMIGVVGFYLRRNQIQESPVFIKSKNQVHDSIFNYKKSLIITGVVGWFAGTLCLSLVGYFPSYLTFIGGLTKQEATLIVNISMVIHMILLPILGFASDKMGTFTLMRLSTVLIFVFSYPMFYLLSSGIFNLSFMGGILFVGMMSLFLAPMHAFMLNLFPPHLRCRGISMSFALGMGMLGGTAPMISTAFIKFFGYKESPAFYFMFCAIVCLISFQVMKKSSHTIPMGDRTAEAT